MWALTADDDTVVSFDGEALVCEDPRFDAWILDRPVAQWSPTGPYVMLPPVDETDAYIAALTFLGEHDLVLAHIEGNVPYVEDLLYPAGRDTAY